MITRPNKASAADASWHREFLNQGVYGFHFITILFLCHFVPLDLRHDIPVKNDRYLKVKLTRIRVSVIKSDPRIFHENHLSFEDR